MKRVHGTHKPLKFALEEDVISRMPENVITNILDRLPIQDAVRTGILSSNWRFKWNFLTQLVFDHDFFWYLHGKDETNKYYASVIITRLLVHLKGPITKFYLHIDNRVLLDVEDVNHSILFLFKKGIKELTVINMSSYVIKLSSHIFSCLDLKHLKLHNCSFHVPPNYCGYPNLLSLNIDRVILESGNCGEIIAQCPLLESMEIRGYKNAIGKVKLAEIEKLENLKFLYFPMSLFDNIVITRSTIFELGRYHPQLQELTLDFDKCTFLRERGETRARKLVHTIFPCLKTLELFNVNLNITSMLSCVIQMIWGSPNLQSFSIRVRYKDDVPPSPPHALTSLEADYNTLGQLPLQNLFFTCWGSENEVCLIKYLLASSPLLKKIAICAFNLSDMPYDTLAFAAKLLKLRRASPLAEVRIMEWVLGTHKASKSCASQEEEDVISKMPENVITHILELLPLQDAVRTGILSRHWRCKWNMLNEVVFDDEFFDGKGNKNETNIISKILLQLKGSITKFVLSIPHYKTLDVKEVGIWVMILSTKGIKDLTLLNNTETSLDLPSHLLSCLNLKRLELRSCSFHTPSTFCGFPNLSSLELFQVTITGNSAGFITNCPLLESLTIEFFKPNGKLKLVDIAKLKNLKMLWLQLHILDNVSITSSTIFQLGGYLTKLQELVLDFDKCKFVGETGARKVVHTLFPCLKTLQLFETDLNSDNMLSCTIGMIWGSPNLQSLTIVPHFVREYDDPPTALVDYNTLAQLQLRYVYLGILGSVNEVYLIGHLLGSSPLLEKMDIDSHARSDRKVELANKLLMFPRASSIAQVELHF